MALVTYSDSEGSDDEEQTHLNRKTPSRPVNLTSTGFAVDKAQPNKIKITLQQNGGSETNGAHEDQPAAKRQRTGAGGFSGFNAMLPAPKRDNLPTSQNGGAKTSGRKVFSLKTGTEAAFSRESDAELRNLFAEQGGEREEDTQIDTAIPSIIPKPAFAKPPAPLAAGSNPFMFKPLSVSRNVKKKKPANINSKPPVSIPPQSQISSDPDQSSQDALPTPEVQRKKGSLFSAGVEVPTTLAEPDEEIAGDDDILPGLSSISEASLDNNSVAQIYAEQAGKGGTQSLDTIASDLNLSKAERRQLFGRSGISSTAQAHNVVNFNTDAEYAANQQLIAAGETVQHNPIRGISAGKHSLRQLVNAASNQKEALEESFAQGKRNKKESGNKYGW